MELLKQAERGDTPITKLCRQYGISEATFYTLRRKYDGNTVSDIKRLRQLEAENARLLKLALATDAGEHRHEGGRAQKALSPAQQRDAAAILVEQGVSQRRASELLGAHRSVLRYDARPRPVSTCALTARLRILATEHPTFGYRRIHAVLRREGMQVNRKRVHRVWRQEQLQLTARPKAKKVRTGQGVPCSAEAPNHV